jgi:hypothetical protein
MENILPVIEPTSEANILIEAEKINVKKASEEILNWLISNVEYFIDSQKRTFKIDMIIDSEKMPESGKLQNLYRAIPSDEEALKTAGITNVAEKIDTYKKSQSKKNKKNDHEQKVIADTFKKVQSIRASLDKITEKVFEEMKSNNNLLEQLFKRMIFYYEMIAINNGRPVVKELVGAVAINNFEYEDFSVNVNIELPDIVVKNTNEKDKIVKGNKKAYTIPASFTLTIEISFKEKNQMTSVF